MTLFVYDMYTCINYYWDVTALKKSSLAKQVKLKAMLRQKIASFLDVVFMFKPYKGRVKF
jgi:hypothetical protein